MKNVITILFAIMMVACPLWADILHDVDALIEAEDYTTVQSIMVEAFDAAESDVVRSELYWRLALAVFMGKTRLIDNMVLGG